MEMMQWNEVLATGIPVIDNQHKKLLELANQLGGAIERGDVEIAEHVLRDLVDYTVYHFSFEEELMEKAGYHLLPLHRRVHQLFTARVLELQQRDAAGDDVLRELHTMLVNWLIKHIQHDDRDYAPAINAYLLEHMHSRMSAAPPTRFAEEEQANATPGAAHTARPAPTPAAPPTTQQKRSLWQRIKAFFAPPPSGHA